MKRDAKLAIVHGDVGAVILLLLALFWLLDQALATPVPTEPVALVRPGVHYEFADSQLEARSTLQEQLLRTAPANVGRVHAWAERLRGVLAPR